MKFAEIAKRVQGIPYTSTADAEVLYNYILQAKPAHCLELGFAHGKASCFVAAALDELGAGTLTCVDRLRGLQWEPTLEQLLKETGLSHRVKVFREHTSYTWFLRQVIAQQTHGHECVPLYDFCFIDGGKNWTVDGMAFFCVEKLLRPGGCILFDDYEWTYADWESKSGEKATDFMSHLEMGPEELRIPHIQQVFDLLVMQHPRFSEFTIQAHRWAWARKADRPRKIWRHSEVRAPFCE